MTLLYFGLASLLLSLIINFLLRNNDEGRYAKLFRSWKYSVLIIFNLFLLFRRIDGFEWNELYSHKFLNSAIVSLSIVCYILFDVQAHQKFKSTAKSEDILDDDYD